MPEPTNQEPKNIDSKINAVVPILLGALLIFVAGWVWDTQNWKIEMDQKIADIQDQKEMNTKFWKLHNQTKEAINRDRALNGEPPFTWDLD